MKDIAGAAKDLAFNNDSLLQWIKGLTQAASTVGGAAAGQAAGAAGEKPAAPKESFSANGKKLSEGQVYMIFNRVSAQQQLTEGPMDFIKGAAAKGMDKLKTVGKNLTTKVTADKLNSAWKKAGSPMDSEEVAKILTAAGVGDDVVGKVYTDLKLPAPGSAPAAGSEENPAAAQAAAGGYAEVKKAIMQLNTKDRKRMIAYLTKQLGTA
jgi:ribosomal protein L12E/L44/L45/RPP1/RPP2